MPILGIIASQISGRLWAPYGAYDALSTVTVGATSVASITFAAIPQGYKHLQVRILSRSTNTSFQQIAISARLNDDSGSNYASHQLFGDGGSAGASAPTVSGTSMLLGQEPSSISNPSNNAFGASVIDILDYASTTKNKTLRCLTGSDINGAGTVALRSGLWMNTGAITSINFFESSTFAQHSQFTLYGVR